MKNAGDRSGCNNKRQDVSAQEAGQGDIGDDGSGSAVHREADAYTDSIRNISVH